MAEEFTFQAHEIEQPSGYYEPAEFSFSAEEIGGVQNKEVTNFRGAQKELAKSPQWKSADALQKKRLMAELLDKNSGGGYVKAQQQAEYQPESFAKGLGRKAIRYTGATLGGVAGGLAAAPTVIGMGPGATAGAMGGYGVGKAFEEVLMGQEPVPPAKERVFKGGTLRQGLAEAIFNVPESVGNLAEGALAFPTQLSKAAMTPGGGKQFVKDTAHMFGAPLGLYGADAAKDAWVLDPAGAALAPSMLYGGLKGLKAKGMAEAGLNKYIAKKYPNAVGMTASEMRKSTDVQKHLADAQEAIKTITALKDDGLIQVGDGLAREARLPKNRMEFSDAIGQAKDYVFKVYDSLKRKAGEQGVQIDSTGLQSELLAIGNDAGLRVMRPELINTATALAERFYNEGPLTPDSASSIIKAANDSYKDFLRNPSPETGGKAILDAMVANNLRKAMETAISSEVGPGWQAYRNKYKQLSTIEKEVTKGAVVDARKSPIGILDFTDMFSAGEAVSGIISLNPAQFAKGGTMFMIKRIYKKLKDPNTAVEKMFRMTDKHYQRPAKMSTEPWINDGPEPAYEGEVIPPKGQPAQEAPIVQGQIVPSGEIEYKPNFTTPAYEGEVIPPKSQPAQEAPVIQGERPVEGQIDYKPNFTINPLKQLPEGPTLIAGEKGAIFDPRTKQAPEMTKAQIARAAKKIGVPIAAVTAYLLADEDTKKDMLRATPALAGVINVIGYHGGPKGLSKLKPTENSLGATYFATKPTTAKFYRDTAAMQEPAKVYAGGLTLENPQYRPTTIQGTVRSIVGISHNEAKSLMDKGFDSVIGIDPKTGKATEFAILPNGKIKILENKKDYEIWKKQQNYKRK